MVDIPLTFSWGMKAATEEDMASQLNYEIKIQGVDASGIISTQATICKSLSLPNDEQGDDSFVVAAGDIDHVVNLIAADADFVAVLPGAEVIVKFNSVLGTPFTVRSGGCLIVDGKNLSAIYITNPSADNAAKVRVIQAQRD